MRVSKSAGANGTAGAAAGWRAVVATESPSRIAASPNDVSRRRVATDERITTVVLCAGMRHAPRRSAGAARHGAARHYNARRMRATAPLCLMLVAAGVPATLGLAQTEPAKAPARSPDTLELSRLVADATLSVRLSPGAVTVGKALWMASPEGAVAIDAATNAVSAPVPAAGTPCASPAVDAGVLWLPRCAPGALARIDTTSKAVTTSTVGPSDPGGSIAACVGSVWVATGAAGVVSRLDPDSREVVAEVYVAREPSGIACAGDALWITSAAGHTLTRVNPHTNVVEETIPVGPRPGRVVMGDGAVWTLNRGDHSVSRVDPATNKVVATIVVGHDAGAGDIAAGEGAVWLSAPGSPLLRIDPRANRVAQRFTGAGGGAVAVAHGSVWVATGPATTWRLDPRLVAAIRP